MQFLISPSGEQVLLGGNNNPSVQTTTSSQMTDFTSACNALIATAVNALLNGADAAHDTFKELQTIMLNDESTAAALSTLVNAKANTIDVTNLLANKVDKVTGFGLSSNDFTTLLLNKLNGIAANATANSADAYLLDRSHHTSTQLSSTISDFTTAVDARVQNIVGAAPSALDTLAEIDAALGNDANFAGTMVTALSGKQAKLTGTSAQYVKGDGSLGTLPAVPANTDGLTEGTTNLYYTVARAVAAIVALIVAGQGITTTYNSGAGTYTIALTPDSVVPLTGNQRVIGTAFQLSTTRAAQVVYAIPITCAATLVLGSRGQATWQYADNSAMTVNPVTLPPDDFGLSSGILVTANGTLKLAARIPAGKWVKITLVNALGTPTYNTIVQQETLVG